VPTDNAAAWDRHAAAYQEGAQLPTDVAHYGPDIGTEAHFRLCGNVEGKRVLELGCGGRQSSIAFARKGRQRHRRRHLERAARLRPPARRPRGRQGRAAPR
jgi:hypothetical protein